VLQFCEKKDFITYCASLGNSELENFQAKYIVLRSLGGVALETADGDAWRGASSPETSHDTCATNGGRLLPALYQGLSEVSRRRRGAVLADLQNEISQAPSSSVYAGTFDDLFLAANNYGYEFT